VHESLAINPILQHILQGRHADAFACFDAIEQPTAEDRAWGGLALLNLNRSLEASELLLVARASGFEDAAVHLLTAYRFLGELGQAEDLLPGIKPELLTGFGRAMLERERGVLAHISGRLDDAHKAMQRAWSLAQADPVAVQIIATFASSLGLVLSDLGRDQQAITYLSRALEATRGSRNFLLTARGFCYTNTGVFAQAEQDLNEARTLTTSGSMALPRTRFNQGVLARTRGLFEEAFVEQLEVAALTRAAGDTERECDAELELAALCTAQDDLPAARAHLSRARGLAHGLRQHALVALRSGAILARAGHERVQEALDSLNLALQSFVSLGLEADQGIAHLHVAEVLARAERFDLARDHLLRALDARNAIGNGTVFAREMRGLPAAFELLVLNAPNVIVTYDSTSGRSRRFGRLETLLEDWRTLEGTAASHITLRTLGGYGLSVNGEPVKVNTGLARTVETLAYLLESGEATLESVKSNVFTDSPPDRAQRYIHVIRQQVTKAIPGLSVPFEPNSRKYRVVTEGVRLHWDALEVREAVKLGGELGLRRALGLYAGPFLPRSDSEWVDELRSTIEFEISTLGAEAVENLYQLGRYETCVELASKLLEVNRLAVAVWQVLVAATRAWKGPVAGAEALEYARRILMSELGDASALADVQVEARAEFN
jgi:tetratricopeptide (TPR) repeat protein